MEIESLIYSGLLQLFGGPLFMGMFMFVMFMAMIVLLKVNETAAVVIFVPVLFIMFEVIPQLKILTAIGIGLLVGLAIIKMTRG
jgi:hypothetical protein